MRLSTLGAYARKRDFSRSPEPPASLVRSKGGFGFVVQQHAARRMHFDFRLELDGVLKSWAVPKGPSLDPRERRMAVEVEDHPVAYAGFEGVIPSGEYGGGTVVVWDRGVWRPHGDAAKGLAKGHLEFELEGEKLRGRWHLVRMRPRSDDRGKRAWLLIKGGDTHAARGASVERDEAESRSVVSGRTLAEVARDADRVWSSRSGGERARPGREPATGGAPRGSRSRAAGRRALPMTLAPQLASLADRFSAGSEWVHEIKLDGYRLLARIERRAVRLYTRAGHDWTARFPRIAERLASLPVDSAWIDGEAVVLDAHGRSRFQQLQNALDSGRPAPVYFAFDLPFLDGVDLRERPLRERKLELRRLLAFARGSVRYHPHVADRGEVALAAACEAGAEGIVSKRVDAPYRSGRTRSWTKHKCEERQEFVVVGFTEPQGTRVGLGALLLAVHDDEGALRYAGKVGTGFSGGMLRTLRTRLEKSRVEVPPVVDPRRAPSDVRWVRPELVAEVTFTEWTEGARIRHPSFIGLRQDKAPATIRRERPDAGDARAPAPSGPPPVRSEVAGVLLTHPDRVYYPDSGITKSEVAQYYEAMAERAVPAIRGRPLSLVRCPQGFGKKCFFQKHVTEAVSSRVGRVEVNRGEEPYAAVRDLASIVSLVQLGVLEFHVWGSRVDAIERPDLLVFDLDPGPSVPWRRVVDTARVLRAWLTDLGLVPFVRTTGGKGLHVVTPILRRSTWDDVMGFTRDVARRMVREAPAHYTTHFSKSRRVGKILIDHLRNQRDATAIASYSLRARPGAPVAMPLAWEELDGASSGPPFFGLREAVQRLAAPDPWSGFEKARRTLTRRMHARVAEA